MWTTMLENGGRLTVRTCEDDARIPEEAVCLDMQETPGGAWKTTWLTAAETDKLVKLLGRHGLAVVAENEVQTAEGWAIQVRPAVPRAASRRRP